MMPTHSAEQMLKDAPRALRVVLSEASTIAPRPPGRLGAERWYVEMDQEEQPTECGMYLKIAHHEEAVHDLAAEHQHLRWLQGRLPVPRIVHHGAHDGRDYLLLTEVAGLPSHHSRFRRDVERVLELLVEALDAISTVDLSDCPFGVTLDHELVAIEERLELGLFDEEAFTEAGRLPGEVFDRLVRDRHLLEANVFSHGDLCMPNVILSPNGRTLSGIIDWGTAGIGDIHRDLSALSWSIDFNLGETWARQFFEMWGEAIDPFRIGYFEDLDLFF